MTDALSFEALEAKRCAIEGRLPEPLALRVRRAISWGLRAEREAKRKDENTDDVRYIFLWIAFNAAYAGAHEIEREREWARAKERARATSKNPPTKPESEVFRTYFRALVKMDKQGRIHDVLDELSDWLQNLMQNEYVFKPFWLALNGIEQRP